MQGAVEFPLPYQSRSDETGVVNAETSSRTHTPFVSSQTAVPELEPPFPFDSCKGARPDGTHVNDELVLRRLALVVSEVCTGGSNTREP